MPFSHKKKTPCKKLNVPIAWYTDDDDKKRIVYYTDCDCKDNPDIFYQLKINSKFQPIPFFVEGQRIGPISISALSGGGKSTYCNVLMEEIINLQKKEEILDLENIYLVTSAQENDPAYNYELYGKIRLDIVHAMENNAELEEFRNSLVVFDDYTNQPYKEMDKWVDSLLKQLLERSRKLKTHLIIANHQQRAGHKTTLLNIESQAFVVFYMSNRNETAKLLKNYLDFNKENIAFLFTINDGRFSTAYVNRNPRYVITNKLIYSY